MGRPLRGEDFLETAPKRRPWGAACMDILGPSGFKGAFLTTDHTEKREKQKKSKGVFFYHEGAKIQKTQDTKN